MSLALLYIISDVVWWYEDNKLKEIKLSQLVSLINVPVLRDKEILYFHGTHEGRKWDHIVTRFVFYSKTKVEFSHMRKIKSISIENSSETTTRMGLLKSIGASIEESIGESIGFPKAVVMYELYEMSDDKRQIKVDVVEVSKGFYIEVAHLEK